MLRRSVLATVPLGALLLLVGCGPSWQVVVQAIPNPFLGQRKYGVIPIDFTGLRVGKKSEAAYLEGKDEEGRAALLHGKAALDKSFVATLAAKAYAAGMQIGPSEAGVPFVIRPSVRWIEPGFYAVSASAASRVRMALRITMPDGRPLDEIVLEHGTPASLANADIEARLKEDGEGLAEALVKYFEVRIITGS
jgi:hypothetical protein